MEYRATQNRARRDIPMRHEARHDIVTRDLAMSKYPVPRYLRNEYFFTFLDRASMNLLIFK
jgi:hypothetical protein